MTSYVSRLFKQAAKRFAVLLVGVMLFLSLTQTAAWAAATQTETESGVAPGISAPLPDEDFEALKEQRREWQSEVSESQDKNSEPESLGETLKEKLNLDEITEGYDPVREAEKRQQKL